MRLQDCNLDEEPHFNLLCVWELKEDELDQINGAGWNTKIGFGTHDKLCPGPNNDSGGIKSWFSDLHSL